MPLVGAVVILPEIGGNPMDSLRIACAERAGALLLTTDDDLVTFFMSNTGIHIRVENPALWLKEIKL
jgi:hypothetical protein